MRQGSSYKCLIAGCSSFQHQPMALIHMYFVFEMLKLKSNSNHGKTLKNIQTKNVTIIIIRVKR